ncbi:MAG TPA: glycosyltransferase family 39 protein [Pyrinomonadaceae bacterium]|jgi:hypothetical protein
MKARQHEAPRSQPLRWLSGLDRPGGVRLLLLLVFGASLFVRCYGLAAQGLECEELYTLPAATGHQYVYLHAEPGGPAPPVPLRLHEYKQLLRPEAGHGFGQVTAVLARNVHLPFYFFLMHLWVRVAGTSERALRLPSVLFSQLALLFLFLLGKELFTPWHGLLAALLLGLMPEQVYFAQQARMYPLLVLFAVATTYLLVRARVRKLTAALAAGYALLSVAGLYTHYEYIFLLAAQTCFVWFEPSLGRARWRAWLGLQLAIALAFSPWLAVGLLQRQASPEVLAWVQGDLGPAALLAEGATELVKQIAVPDIFGGWLSVLLAVALLALGVRSLRGRRVPLLLLAAWIIAPLAGMLLLDQVLHAHAISITRYWLIITPALYLLMAAGVLRLSRPAWRLAAVLALTLFLLPAAYWTGRGELRRKPDRHREMARFIDQQAGAERPPTLLAEGVNSIPLALAYYGQVDATIIRHKWLLDQLAARTFDEVLGGAQDVWVLVSGEGRIVRLLEENGYRRTSVQILFGHVLVSRYSKRNALT